jgi:hypothetical protein
MFGVRERQIWTKGLKRRAVVMVVVGDGGGDTPFCKLQPTNELRYSKLGIRG